MKKTLLGAAAVLVLSACSTRDFNKPLEVWDNFSQTSPSASSLSDEHALLVLYRENDVQGPAVNVYINGSYQASLLPNAFTPVTVCANKNLLSSSFSTNTEFGNRTQGVQYSLPAQQVSFVKVVQSASGQLAFAQVSSDEASMVVSQLPKENQTLPRTGAPKDCNVVLETFSLDASALFAFNKSSYKDILPQGKKEINAFAQKINSFEGVTSISVAGHTDPVGSSRYNQALSQKRANTVKEALEKRGVSLPISATGYGEAQPVVTGCERLKGKAQQKCNQPNRRVEIILTGNK